MRKVWNRTKHWNTITVTSHKLCKQHKEQRNFSTLLRDLSANPRCNQGRRPLDSTCRAEMSIYSQHVSTPDVIWGPTLRKKESRRVLNQMTRLWQKDKGSGATGLSFAVCHTEDDGSSGLDSGSEPRVRGACPRTADAESLNRSGLWSYWSSVGSARTCCTTRGGLLFLRLGPGNWGTEEARQFRAASLICTAIGP